jgi:hypothetical protein
MIDKRVSDLEASLRALLDVMDEIAAEGIVRVYAKDKKQMEKARKLLMEGKS